MTSPLTPERKQEIRERIDKSTLPGEVWAVVRHIDVADLFESHEALVEALKKSDHLANCNAAIYQDGCGRGKKDDCYWLDYLCAIHSPDGFVCDCGRDAALRNAGVQS